MMSVKTETLSPPRRYLTDDEIDSFSSYKRDHRFRVRIWQGKDATAIVLISQVDGDIQPHLLSSNIANSIFAYKLGFPDFGMLIYQDYIIPDGSRCLEQVYFEYIGCGLRRRLFKPISKHREWEWLESVLEEKVER